jgi:hypothetical protein
MLATHEPADKLLPLLDESEAVERWVPAFAGTTTGELPFPASMPILSIRLTANYR